MDTFRIVKIVTLITLIFAAGIATGRFTRQPQATTNPITLETTNRHGTVVNARTVLQNLDTVLRLTAAQEQRILPNIERMLEEIARAPVASPERFDSVRKWRPKLREILHPEQLSSYEKLVERQEQRMRELQSAQRPK